MGSEIRLYRDLVAWQKGMNLVEQVYRETASLPDNERYGLVAQLRRCAVSVPCNIAEGWGRSSRNDYVRFLRMSQGSLYELATQAELCERLSFDGNWSLLVSAVDEVRRILYGLIRSLTDHH